MPQPFNNAVMTDGGAGLLTRAQTGDATIEFTRIAVGNGIYTAEEKALDALQRMRALKSLKNSYVLSETQICGDRSVKLTALITNQDPVTKESLVEEGYYINEIGLYARAAGTEGEDVLYSIAVTSGEAGDFMPPYNGYNPAQIIQDYYATVSNASEVFLTTANRAVALAEDLNALRSQVAEVDAGLSALYQQMTGYTDQKIADLINGAPSTLDTLGEIAQAMQENGDVVAALEGAIGSKANEAEFESFKGATETFLGNSNIADIGGGTVTGAILALYELVKTMQEVIASIKTRLENVEEQLNPITQMQYNDLQNKGNRMYFIRKG